MMTNEQYWKREDGEVIAVGDMNEHHAKNVLRKMIKKSKHTRESALRTRDKISQISDTIAYSKEPCIKNQITNINAEAIFADGFDGAIIGYDANSFCCVYDYDKCLKILIERDDMSYSEAHEFMQFNVISAYVGDFMPIYINSL